MRSFTLLSFAAAIAAAPVCAQNTPGAENFENALNGALGRIAASPVRLNGPAVVPPASSRAKALQDALTAMRDGPLLGGEITTYMNGSKKVVVEFKTQAANSVFQSGNPDKVILSDALPAYARVMGPLVAREVSASMDVDMPDCAEKRYMRISREARIWLELGGEPKILPEIEAGAYKDAALAAEIKRWVHGYQDPEGTAADIAASDKVPTLAALKSKAADPAAKARLDAAAARFKAFTDAELEWYKNTRGTVALP